MTETLVRDQIRRLTTAWAKNETYACACPSGVLPAHSLQCCLISGYNSTTGEANKNAGCTYSYDETTGVGDVNDATTDTICKNNFLPPSLNVSFEEISGEEVTRVIVSLIPDYLRGIYTKDGNAAFVKHNDPSVVKSWEWNSGGLKNEARDEGLYCSHNPIMNYSTSEVIYRCHNYSLTFPHPLHE